MDASPCNSTLESFNLEAVEDIAATAGIDREEMEKRLVVYMNRFYCVVKDTSTTFVEKTINKGEVDYIKRTQRGFKNALSNKAVVYKTTKVKTTRNTTKETTVEVTINLYDLWMKSKHRCEFSRFAFGEEVSKDSFNLFHGLRIRGEDTSKYTKEQAMPWVEHVRRIWCRNDDKTFQYTIRYLAHIVQRPFTKTKVAFVVRSMQGAGKGSVLEKLQSIFGSYFKTVKPKDFMGDFNGVLSDALVLFLDECVFSGDKRMAAELKTLITEASHQINSKYLSTATIENHLNLFVATNYSWCAPIEESDRRYFVLELDNRYAGKTTEEIYAYFGGIKAVPYQAVYLYLMSVSLEGFVPSIYPITPVMREQKIYTMDSTTAWLYYVLTDGSLTEGVARKIGLDESTFDKRDLYEAYTIYCKDRGGHYAKPEQYSRYFMALRKMVPEVELLVGSKVKLPNRDKLKAALRAYLDDPDFPI